MLFKLLLFTVIISVTLQQIENQDCKINAQKSGVLGYPFNSATGKRDTTAPLKCQEYDTQNCYQQLSLLSADKYQVTSNTDSDIIAFSSINGSNLDVNLAQFGWNEGGYNCQFEYVLRMGKVPVNSIADSKQNLQAWIDQAEILTDTIPEEKTNTYAGTTKAGKTWTKNFLLSNILANMTVFQKHELNSVSSVFAAQFTFSIYSNGNEKLMYAFLVELTNNKEKSLTTTKTLVAGQCCKNSLRAVTQVRFCSFDDQWCTTSIDNIDKNKEFYVQHILYKDDPETNYLASIYNLYPDEIKIGSFFPEWYATEGTWGRNDDTINGISILIKSNIAINADVSVTSRLWDKKNKLPHKCFYKRAEYGNNDQNICTQASTRRILDDSQSGHTDTQVSASLTLIVNDDSFIIQEPPVPVPSEHSNNQNLIIIIVPIAIAIVFIFIGIMITCCCCRKKKAKVQNINQQEQNQSLSVQSQGGQSAPCQEINV